MVIRKATLEDTEAFLRLVRQVREGMQQKDWFYLDPPEDVRAMMEDGSMIFWAAMDGERMVAVFSILMPGLEGYSYGRELNFSEEALLRVVHMDTAAVHPDYRGRGLQRRLMAEAEAYARTLGNRILLTTVHPENRYSLENILSLGYVLEKELPMYGSRRYLLRKDLP